MRWIILLFAVNAGLLLAAWAGFAFVLKAALGNVPLLADALMTDQRGAAGRAQPSSPGAPIGIAEGLPSLTVVVAARDERPTIGTTVRRILAQRYEGLQIVVVDDRSTDGTGEVLKKLSTEGFQEGRLEVVSNTSLPEGWLGKCHACRLGAARSRGAWILFMDGDVTLVDDGLLARVVRLAERSGLDHVAVLPDLRPMPRLQSAIVSAFGQGFLVATRTYEMDRDLPRGGVGVGAFNLVRRSAYDRIGGHEGVKMDPGDDLKLGMLLKASGARQRLFDGVGLVKCRWQHGSLNVIRGFEKNGFSGCGYSVRNLIAFSAVALWMALGPIGAAAGAAALFKAGAQHASADAVSPARARAGSSVIELAHGTVTDVAASTDLIASAMPPGVADGLPDPGAIANVRSAAVGAGWLPLPFQAALLFIGFSIARRRGYSENPLVATILYPLGVTLMVVALWNSAVRTLANGGMTWRGTFYPLDALRRGLVRPGGGRRLAR